MIPRMLRPKLSRAELLKSREIKKKKMMMKKNRNRVFKEFCEAWKSRKVNAILIINSKAEFEGKNEM